MDLTGPARVVAFPPGRRGVLLPVDDRRTAALGVGLFTACKPRVIAIQRAAAATVRLLGARALLARPQTWERPYPDAEWAALVGQWRDLLGPLDGVALYQRRQLERAGSTLLVTTRGAPTAVLKVRPGPDGAEGLDREQQALAAVSAAAPTSFSSPAPLGRGHHEDLHWSAQQVVFDRPHHPVLTLPAGLLDEVRSVLAPLDGAGDHPAHGDLTPWNLRRDQRGEIWLYDWEDWRSAPPDADLAYFSATAAAVAGTPLPTGLDPAGVELWWRLVTTPGERPDPNQDLADAIRSALATMLREAGGPAGGPRPRRT